MSDIKKPAVPRPVPKTISKEVWDAPVKREAKTSVFKSAPTTPKVKKDASSKTSGGTQASQDKTTGTKESKIKSKRSFDFTFDFNIMTVLYIVGLELISCMLIWVFLSLSQALITLWPILWLGIFAQIVTVFFGLLFIVAGIDKFIKMIKKTEEDK